MPNPRRMAARLAAKALAKLLDGMAPGDVTWLARNLFPDRDSPGASALSSFSQYYREIFYLNGLPNMQLNGEFALLQKLADAKLDTIFDVGANVGDWTLTAKRIFPSATVHAFEIIPKTADQMQDKIAGFDRIHLNRFGLADSVGEIDIWVNSDENSVSSIIDARTQEFPDFVAPWLKQLGQVIRGDGYVADHGLANIDFLKIDVEGAEMRVLSGFEKTFDKQAIQIVQFEYCRLNRYIPLLLRDFYAFFEPRGYQIGKVFPKGVAFKPYEMDDEDFVGLTYIACRSVRTDLIERMTYST